MHNIIVGYNNFLLFLCYNPQHNPALPMNIIPYLRAPACLLSLGIFSLIACWCAYEMCFQLDSSVLYREEYPYRRSNASENRVETYMDAYRNDSADRSGRLLSVVHGSDGPQRDYCNVSHVQSWEMGVVTLLEPKIQKQCEVLAANSETEINRVAKALETWENIESYEAFFSRMSNCSNVIKEFSNLFYVSPEEQEFPLAYMLVVHTSARQVIRLLKAIYRPQNVYCIHPDAKREEQFAQVFYRISDCLENVFVASKRTKVYYAHYSILEAQLNCMEDLIKYHKSRWKYAINLVGRELPLKTNREIVNILSGLNGLSVVNSHPIEQNMWNQRFQYKYKVSERTGKTWRSSKKLDPVPYGIEIFKGSTHFAITGLFAHFLLTGKKAIDFREYLRDVQSPEESFYASLYRLPEAAFYGGYPGNVTTDTPRIPRWLEATIWLIRGQKVREPSKYCSGKVVHFICIANSGDLHRIYESALSWEHFFFNKYSMEEDHVVMDCIEERLIAHNRKEYAQDCL